MRSLFGNSRSTRPRKEDENAAHEDPLLEQQPIRPPVGYAYLGNDVGLTRTHRGHQILVFTRDYGISPHIITHGLWEPNIERAILKLLEPGFVVAEVGANVGYHSLAMADAIGSSGHLYAFEANPRLFTLLQWSLDLNGFKPRTTLHNIAATNHAGDVRFDFEPIAAGGGHVVRRGAAESANAFTIRCERLDISLAGLETIDLLRMDAEGSEPLIVEGAIDLIRRSPNIRIVTEWSTVMMRDYRDVGAYTALLRDLGFQAWQIDANADFIPVQCDRLETLPHCELVFSRDNINPESAAPHQS